MEANQTMVQFLWAYWGGNRFCSKQFFFKAVLNVHNLFLAGYCEQDRLSLYGWGMGLGGYSQATIESEVRLTFKKKTYLDTLIENAAEDR